MTFLDLFTMLDYVYCSKEYDSEQPDAIKAKKLMDEIGYKYDDDINIVLGIASSFGSTSSYYIGKAFVKQFVVFKMVDGVFTPIILDRSFDIAAKEVIPSLKLLHIDSRCIIFQFIYEGMTYTSVIDLDEIKNHIEYLDS